MKRLFLFTSFLFSFALKAMTAPITIAGDNWCPINCGANDAKQGYMIDVARAALKRSGYEVQYLEMPWTRAVGLARKGEVNAIVGAFKGDAPDFHFPAMPLLKMSPNDLFVTKNSQWTFENLRSLNKITLGSIKGYDYGDELNRYIHSMLATEDANLIQLYGNDAVTRSLQFLLKGRIDVLVETGPVFWFHAKQLDVTNKVKSVGSISQPEPCFIAFSPNLEISPKLVLAFDKGVITLKQEKKLALIAESYGLPKDAL